MSGDTSKGHVFAKQGSGSKNGYKRLRVQDVQKLPANLSPYLHHAVIDCEQIC